LLFNRVTHCPNRKSELKAASQINGLVAGLSIGRKKHLAGAAKTKHAIAFPIKSTTLKDESLLYRSVDTPSKRTEA